MTEKDPKTLRDYLLDGGVKNRTFYHFCADYPASAYFYTVQNIEPKHSPDDRTKALLVYLVIKRNETESCPIEFYLTDKEATKEQLEQLALSVVPAREEERRCPQGGAVRGME